MNATVVSPPVRERWHAARVVALAAWAKPVRGEVLTLQPSSLAEVATRQSSNPSGPTSARRFTCCGYISA
jgi:hypothetical protein